MAETLISPGVLSRENDQSQITAQPIQAGAALIGPTVLGKPGIPTLVTTYSEYLATFGSTFLSGSNEYSFLTSDAAFNYFQNAGTSLLVTRVTSGSFSAASSSAVSSAGPLNTGITTYVTNAFNTSGSTEPNTETTVTNYTSSGNGTGAIFTIITSNSQSLTSIDVTTVGSGYRAGETLTFPSESLGATLPNGEDLVITLASNNINFNNVFTLETLGEGTVMNSTSTETARGVLPSGSSNNIRWEISNPNISRGVFSLIIRQGNDTTNSKSILESFNNVSLDPKASNYIARIIGDTTTNLLGAGTSDPYLQESGSFPNASRYVRVKSVNLKTPDYFDNNGVAKPEFADSIPSSQSGSFGGGVGNIVKNGQNFNQNINDVDTQGLAGTDYTDAINLLANKDDYQYNIISTPGLIYANGTHKTQLDTLISNTENRGDAIIVMDLENYGSTVTAVGTAAASLDTSYAASYWPWLQITDSNSGQLVWVPASTVIPGVYAYTDNVSESWFAPAGINRGGLGTVRQAV
mgnify:CR=1 FL=1